MKKQSALLLVSVLAASAFYALAAAAFYAKGATNHVGKNPVLEQQAKAKVQEFAKALKSELQGAIQRGGLTEGIEVCKQRAPDIAASLSVDGWHVGRTSLKVRNPDNQPDAWERETLMSFSAMWLQGTSPDKLIATTQNAQEFRFMKGIPTAGLCLSCHGQTLPEEVSDALKDHYPDDQATGFQAGDLRGAFTLTKTLNEDGS